MTRKEALSKAIKALSEDEGYDEVTTILEDIYEELPLIHWTDKSIRDTVEQFIVDNGRNPSTTDFRKKSMPPHPVIKQKYNVTLSEWLEKNYPNYIPTFEELKRNYTSDFIKEYMQIKPTSGDDFNKRRSKHTKSWQTVAKYHNTSSWIELLDKLSLEKYSRVAKFKHKQSFDVTIDNDAW